MSNPIKYSTGSETLALKKGNFYIGTGAVGKGPTSETGYYNGITPPSGGYTIYLNKAIGGPSIYTASNDAQLISLTNSIAGQSYTGTQQCFDYFYGQTDKLLVNQDYPADYPYIVMDGLVLNLDAGITQSYPGSGTVWTDVNGLGPKNNGTLINGPTFSSNDGGSIVFDGVDDYATIANPSLFQVNNLTIDVWLRLEQNLGSNVNFRGIFSTINGSSGYQLFYFGSNNTYFYFFRDNLTIKSVPETYSSGTLLNIVCTYEYNNSSKCGIFINSVNKTDGIPVPGSTSNSSLSPTIGGPRADLSGGYYLNSKHYVVRFYNRALSASEVLQNYNATKGRFGL